MNDVNPAVMGCDLRGEHSKVYWFCVLERVGVRPCFVDVMLEVLGELVVVVLTAWVGVQLDLFSLLLLRSRVYVTWDQMTQTRCSTSHK